MLNHIIPSPPPPSSSSYLRRGGRALLVVGRRPLGQALLQRTESDLALLVQRGQRVVRALGGRRSEHVLAYSCSRDCP